MSGCCKDKNNKAKEVRKESCCGKNNNKS
ncbi:hypothetical protein V1477_018915 [Vespula maculifrons]|uniref:Uncharacterized protein n=1 Tax=Vespula maculifrons TaxID=7453 RepID=A0ABD2ASS5_VESMC